MGVGSSSDWSCFDDNKWKALPAETSKQIDDTVRKNWSNTKSNLFTFPLTKGHFFSQHPGVYFCRIGLNPNRTQIIESALGNKETGNEVPMRRVPPFIIKMHPHRNQGHNNEPTHRVMIRSPRGTVIRYMTEHELRNYGYLMNKPVASTQYDIKEDKERIRDPNTKQPHTNFNSKNIRNWTNKDLLAWIKTIGLETKWEEIMTKAIKSTVCTGRHLFAVKHFKEFAKVLNIKQPMLANKVFREFRKVKQKQVNINDNDNDNDNDVAPVAKSKQSKVVFACSWQSKHINNWTCNELQEWICSLNLSVLIERKVVCAISEQEITGQDFNSMEEMSEVIDSFEIKEISAKLIYAALLRVRISINENALKKLYGNQV